GHGGRALLRVRVMRTRVVRGRRPAGGRSVPRLMGRRQRRTHCVLHPVPLRLVLNGLGVAAGDRRRQRGGARSLPNGTFPGRRLVNGRGRLEVPSPTRQIGRMTLRGTYSPTSPYAASSTAGSGPSRTVGLASPSRTMKRSRSPRDFLSTLIVSS